MFLAYERKKWGCIMCAIESGDGFSSTRPWADMQGVKLTMPNGQLNPDHVYQFDMDHIHPVLKDMAISDIIHKHIARFTPEMFVDELDKCQCLCKHHHAQKSHVRQRKDG